VPTPLSCLLGCSAASVSCASVTSGPVVALRIVERHAADRISPELATIDPGIVAAVHSKLAQEIIVQPRS
jgi:hypothetical protein